jgi:hypothetical protein
MALEGTEREATLPFKTQTERAAYSGTATLDSERTVG